MDPSVLFMMLLVIKVNMLSATEFTDGINLNTEQTPHCEGNMLTILLGEMAR